MSLHLPAMAPVLAVILAGNLSVAAAQSPPSPAASSPPGSASGSRSAAGSAAADDSAVGSLMRQIERLERTVSEQSDRIDSQGAELSRIRTERGEAWLSEERATQIRGLVTDVLADADRRASFAASGATSGYDKGFVITSPDGNFLLRLNGQIQARYAFSRLSTSSQYQLDAGTFAGAQFRVQSQNGVPVFPGGVELKGYQGTIGGANNIARTARGFEIRRMRLFFSGYVVDPSWQYQVIAAVQQTGSQTEFTSVTPVSAAQVGGVQSAGATAGNASAGPGPGGGTFVLQDAWILKKLDEHWSLQVGQFKAPLLREELTSSRFLLAADRSLVNQLFSVQWSQGAQVTFVNDTVRLFAGFNDGGNNANTSAIIGNRSDAGGWSEYALSARAEWKIAGRWEQFNDMVSYPGDDFAAYIGAAVNWQRGGGANGVAWPDTWAGGGANGNFAQAALLPPGSVIAGGTPVVAPIVALQYPNNIPTNGNDDVSNITWSVDSMWDFGGFNVYVTVIGNIAYNIPAGWVANPSGGFLSSAPGSPPGVPNDFPSNVSAVSSGGLTPFGQPAPPAAVFVPGYGYGYSPIYSFGAVVQGGWFMIDDLQLFGRYEWYDTLNNGQNAYAGNTATFWGFLPGGASPFANNSNNDNSTPGFTGPNKGVNTPADSYIGGNTNPAYAFNLGANPYAAQMNSVITFGFNWYPAGFRVRNVKVTGDLSYAFRPVLFVNGIYGAGISGTDFRSDGGLSSGGQVVGRLQLQLLF